MVAGKLENSLIFSMVTWYDWFMHIVYIHIKIVKH